MPQEMGAGTQHEGGSEVTQVSAVDARDGKAVGFIPKPFGQVIAVSQNSFDSWSAYHHKLQELVFRVPVFFSRISILHLQPTHPPIKRQDKLEKKIRN